MGFQKPEVLKGILMEHGIGAPLSSKYHTAWAIDATVGMGIDMSRPINESPEKSWNPTLRKRLHHRVHCYSLYVGVVSPYQRAKTRPHRGPYWLTGGAGLYRISGYSKTTLSLPRPAHVG